LRQTVLFPSQNFLSEWSLEGRYEAFRVERDRLLSEISAGQEGSMIGEIRRYTAREENCAENVIGKLGIGSRLELKGCLMVITHFGEPHVKDGHRVVDFYTEEILPIPTSTEDKKNEGCI